MSAAAVGVQSLIDLPLDAALIVKRRAGEAKYDTDPTGASGKPAFRGDPLKELYDEILDGLNYCDYALRMGYTQSRIRDISLLLRTCRDIAQEEYRHQGGFLYLAYSSNSLAEREGIGGVE